MNDATRITQKELAERLKLSQATVSRALAKSPLLSGKTINRVYEEAKKIGYRPDPALASLNSYLHAKRPISKGNVIAWLGRHAPSKVAEIPWATEVFNAAQTRGEELGYKVDYFWLNDPQLPLQRLEQILVARNVLGVVLDAQKNTYSHSHLIMSRYSAVAIGRTLHAPKIDQISPDHFHSVTTSYQELHRKGYRRIGLAISKEYNERSLGQWHAGYLMEQTIKQASPLIPILDCKADNSKVLAKWLSDWKPDSIITASETDGTEHILRAETLAKLGYKIPDDIAIALVNITEKISKHDFSGVQEPISSIGEGVIDILVRRICQNSRGVPRARMVSLIEGIWHAGKTT